MKTKINVSIALLLWCALATMSAQAVVSIGPRVIVTGTKIEVVIPGPDLQGIINGITDAAEDKPYLIKLGVGEFTIVPDATSGSGLRMKPYISIIGSGQGVTVLTGAVSSGTVDGRSAIVEGADNAALTDLSVVNTGGGGTNSIGIYNAASPRIERVTATASGGTFNYGVWNRKSPTMIDVVTTASGGTTNAGVTNSDASSPMLVDVTATASGGAASNTGVNNLGSSSPILINVTAIGKDGATNNTGVGNLGSSSPTLIDVTATGEDGITTLGIASEGSSSPILFDVIATGKNGSSFNYGLYSFTNTVVLTVDASTLTGATAALRFGGNTGARIANSRVIGNVLNNPAGVNCGGVYNVNLTLVNC